MIILFLGFLKLQSSELLRALFLFIFNLFHFLFITFQICVSLRFVLPALYIPLWVTLENYEISTKDQELGSINSYNFFLYFRLRETVELSVNFWV